MNNPAILGAFLYALIAAVCINMVGMATPLFSAKYNVDQSSVTYVTAVYLLAELSAIGFFPYIYQRLSPIKTLKIAGGGFVFLTAACAIAPTFFSLCVLRALQGLLGGVLIPLANTLIREWGAENEQKDLNFRFSLFMSIAPVIGICWGGVTGSVSPIYLFALPVCIGVFAGYCINQADPTNLIWKPTKSNAPHAVMLFSAGLLILGDLIERGREVGYWSSMFWRMEAYCATLLIVTSGCALWFAQNAQLRLSLLANARVRLICFLSGLVGVVVYGFIFAVPYYFFVAHDYQSSDLIYVMLITSGTQLVFTPLFRQVVRKFNYVYIASGSFLGLSAAAFSCSLLNENSGWLDVIPSQLLRAMFSAPLVLSLSMILNDDLDDEDVTHGNALFNIARLLGGALGISLFVAIVEYKTVQNMLNVQSVVQYTPFEQPLGNLASVDAFSFAFQALSCALVIAAALSLRLVLTKNILAGKIK